MKNLKLPFLIFLFMLIGVGKGYCANDKTKITVYYSDGESKSVESNNFQDSDYKNLAAKEIVKIVYIDEYKKNILSKLLATSYGTINDSVFRTVKEIEFSNLSFKNNSDLNMSGMFKNCSNLEKIDLSLFSNITSLNNIFNGCISLENVVFSNDLNHTELVLSNGSFNGCVKLKEVDFGGIYNLKSINNAFSGCSALQKVSFSKEKNANDINLKNNPFTDCTSLLEVDFGGMYNITALDNGFAGCKSLEKVIFSSIENENVINIPQSVFQDCANLEEVDLSGLINISSLESAFAGLKNLHTVKLSKSTEQTNVSLKNAFNGCVSLKGEIDLSGYNSITTLESAFEGCSSITGVKFSGNNDYTKEISLYKAFLNCTSLSDTIVISQFKLGNCKNAFQNCVNLKNVVLPTNLTGISGGTALENTFNGCSSLTSLDLTGLKEIESISGAFKNCSSLKEIKLPDEHKSGKHIEFWYTFQFCTSLEKIDLTGWNIKLLNHTFDSCTNIKEIILPEVITFGTEVNNSIYRTFADCKNLEGSINMSQWSDITELKQSFKNCKKITSIFLPKHEVANYNEITDWSTGVNPNCLIFIAPGETIDYKTGNLPVVIGDDQTGYSINDKVLTITEDCPFSSPKQFTATYGASYTRSKDDWSFLNSGIDCSWTSIMLPFDGKLYVDDVVKEPFANNATQGCYWLRELADCTDSLNFIRPDDIEVKANTPYIISFPGTKYNANFDMTLASNIIIKSDNGVTIPASEEGIRKDNSYTFKGSYKRIEADDCTDFYMLNKIGDTFMKIDDTTYDSDDALRPFRSYITVNQTSPQYGARFLGIGYSSSVSTDILPLNDDLLPKKRFYVTNGILMGSFTEKTTVNIYSLSGSKIYSGMFEEGEYSLKDDLSKGIYIVNGEKIVI